MLRILCEGNDSSVKAVRFVPFEKMAELKASCEKQLKKTSQEVDFFIQRLYARFRIPDLIENASYHFTVPAADVLTDYDDDEEDEEISSQALATGMRIAVFFRGSRCPDGPGMRASSVHAIVAG